MNRKGIAIIIVVLIGVISTTIYLSMTGRIQMGEKINVQEKAGNIQEEVQAIKEAHDREVALISQFGSNSGIINSEGLGSGYLNYFGSPDKMVEYTFGTLISGELDLFINSFDINTFMRDISEGANYEDKIELVEEMMQRLSRNDTLDEVNLISSEVYSDGAKASVLLIYEDKKTVRLTLDFNVYEDSHIDAPKSYYISNSIWELIEIVETEVKE